ncbi:MAG TPA: tetratricopeptide repeat protein [Cyclobacteriaceae bacterium]|nr:tetratricopeptide repeat protein [Cyclobacteriaceae bacterium]HRG80215.1 tetratricopeptide repeat protein [Cyclobacteriaceae bacterium]
MHRVLLIFFLSAITIAGFSQNPKWTAWETEADTLMSQQKFKEAAKLYTKVIYASKLKDKTSYRSLYKRAVAYYSDSDFQKAIKDMDRFIPEFPENYQAHVLRALAYRESGDVDNQLTDVEAALELSGGDPQIMKWRASLLMEKGEYKLAKDDLVIVKQFQDDPEVEMNLAFAYYSLDNPDSAMMAINKSIELDATFGPAYLYGGSFSLEQENYEMALKYLNVALKLDPDNVTALFYKGVALVELKKEAEGCSCLSKAFMAGQDDAADYLKQYCYGIEK